MSQFLKSMGLDIILLTWSSEISGARPITYIRFFFIILIFYNSFEEMAGLFYLFLAFLSVYYKLINITIYI